MQPELQASRTECRLCTVLNKRCRTGEEPRRMKGDFRGQAHVQKVLELVLSMVVLFLNVACIQHRGIRGYVLRGS